MFLNGPPNFGSSSGFVTYGFRGPFVARTPTSETGNERRDGNAAREPLAG